MRLFRYLIHSVAGDLALNDATVPQALHSRGILTVGIPHSIAPINPLPTPKAVLTLLDEASLHRMCTPNRCTWSVGVATSARCWKLHCPSSRARSQAPTLGGMLLYGFYSRRAKALYTKIKIISTLNMRN
jgi:hypothetical protein